MKQSRLPKSGLHEDVNLDNMLELPPSERIAEVTAAQRMPREESSLDSGIYASEKNAAAQHAAEKGLVNMEASGLCISEMGEDGRISVTDNMGNELLNEGQDVEGGGREDGYVGEDNPNAVIKMGPDIRIAFRFKLLGLITINLVAILLLAFAIVAIPTVRKATLTADWVKAAAVVCFMWALFGLTVARDKYPYNYIALAFFTLATAGFFGFMHYDFNDFANFQILSVLTAEMFLFTFFATRAWPVWLVEKVKICFKMDDPDRASFHTNPYEEVEEVVLTPLVYASTLSWFVVLVLHMIIVTKVTYKHTPLGTAIGVEMFVFCVCVWFGYDASMIEKRLGPDDYMLGVVSFWADCIICVFCCCCIAFAGS